MEIKMRSFILSILITTLFHGAINAQTHYLDINRLLHVPCEYTVLKTTEKIQIDGKDDEKDWSKAPWTELFTNIESGDKIDPINETHCKMLWDNYFLYLYVQLEESDIWASLRQHDSHIFQDNAFEMFIDTDGDNFNYFEFQINAYGAVWDLFMPKPYRNGGQALTSWDMKGLKKAIHLNGTLNNPADTDRGWSIELAIPFKSVNMSGNQHPTIGTIWRMNFSRVQWDIDTSNGKYLRRRDDATGKLLSEHYTVWSPQGIINLHYPERWGYVLFSDKLSSSGFLSAKVENLKLILWKYYYLQQEFKRENGKYANTIEQLDRIYTDVADLKEKESKIQMYVNEYQFWIQCFFSSLNEYIAIDEEGEVHIENIHK